MLRSKFFSIKSLVNQTPPIYWILFYLIFHFYLVFSYTKQTNYNFNLLIHINQKYIELNPETKFSSLVVLEQEGYDGQFFYFLSRYIYDKNIKTVTLDSSTFRMLRIGVSVLYGFLPYYLGWSNYAILGILLNILIFIVSFIMLYKLLDQDSKYVSFFYLFNPFSFVSNMLLIGDNFFISFFVIFAYFFSKSLGRENHKKKQMLYYFGSLFFSIFLVFLKETALFYFLPLFFYFFIKKDMKNTLLFSIPIWFFFIWFFMIKSYIKVEEISSLSHLERIRVPFKDLVFFYFSLIENFITNRNFSKTFPYILLLFILISLGFQLINFLRIYNNFKELITLKFFELFFYAPIALVILSVVIVDYEYWLAFDNIFRIFAFAFLWIIFLIVLRKLEDYNDYGFFFLLTITTVLLGIRYYYKKIGDFTIL
ncbi:MAG: hypothetical protein ACK4UJ_02400 [Leptonema sp. (in: bacteria)]